MNERIMLMNNIRKYDFALNDLNLFLDTHYDSKEALLRFKKYQELRHKAVSEYEEKYGPITACSSDIKDEWKWTKAPWPWEKEAD